MFNLRTLYQTGKLDQLLRGARNLPLDIIGIQEHQLITKETLSQYRNEECEFMFIYSSAFQPQVGGVVLLICKIFANSYMAAGKVSEQILKVYFKGNPLIVMFVIYAPSNVANDSDKAAFFSDLHESLQGATSLHCHHAWPRPQDDKPTSLLALSSWRWRSSSLLCFFTLFQLFKTLLKKLFVSLLNALFTIGYLPG